MKKEPVSLIGESFRTDVYNGLTSYPKKLSSKYFYDEKGDELFENIMQLPEYYLTETEHIILEENSKEIARAFSAANGFDLIELGAGNGQKTKILLRQLLEDGVDFTYQPVDISPNILEQLRTSINEELPAVKISPRQGTYTQVLENLREFSSRKKVILFLGSNLGNLLPNAAVDFLKKISSSMAPEDLLFIGLDQKKHPRAILNAYNDDSGVTAAFNLNLLERINRELSANFDSANFLHWPVYDPETGTAKSYLVSKKAHTVNIKSLNLEVAFDAWESIHTEISQKYDEKSMARLTGDSGMEIINSFTDKEGYFKDLIIKIKS